MSLARLALHLAVLSVALAAFCGAATIKRSTGMQARDWCHCGNSYGRYGQVADSECKLKCSGNIWKDNYWVSGGTCGGHWRNEVYSTGL
uniref:DUF3011 domain-containing protein n=1 Tax=Macrostomum lignano TaxID=282301 RepID=A0A1I8J604_9PLAT